MTMQYPLGSTTDKYKKKLFIDTGFGYTEVNARIIEPYSPPTPQPNVKEIKIINAPSHFHQTGLSSYQATLNLLFDDRAALDDYLMRCGWTHKFYDEKGFIYIGTLINMKQSIYEAGRRYKVEIQLTLIKKDLMNRKHLLEFQDLEVTGDPDKTIWSKQDIEEMADLGLISVIARDGQPVLYFRPDDRITRAEFITFLNRTRRWLERIIRE